jgi:predicted transcriptional regulator
MKNLWLNKGRRSKVQIAADILKLSYKKDTTESELMKCVNMSHQQSKKYLNWLLKLELLNIIEVGQDCCSYRSTAKGQSLLSVLNKVRQMLVDR